MSFNLYGYGLQNSLFYIWWRENRRGLLSAFMRQHYQYHRQWRWRGTPATRGVAVSSYIFSRSGCGPSHA